MFRKHSNRRNSGAGPRSSGRTGGSNSIETSSKPASIDSLTNRERPRFVLYVEGARDREILGTWARRVEPAVARCIEQSTVILGGRQPARAVRDFRKRGGFDAGWRGLIVLDRDHHEDEQEAMPASPADEPDDSGLELFVWGLRHIESYLLVPSAIQRALGFEAGDGRVEDALADSTSAHAGDARLGLAGPHAKRILGAGGSLSEALGSELQAGEIARAMRAEDLHDDVHTLFRRIGTLSGAIDRGPEVFIRSPRVRD